MKQSDVLIWLPDSMLADPDVQTAIKGFGGILVNGENGKSLSETYRHLNNLYDIGQAPNESDAQYLGEFATRKLTIPGFVFNLYNVFADESSPKDLAITASLVEKAVLGFSSYRTALFTIFGLNLRIPILSPLWTLNRLNNEYGARHRFVWLDLKKNLYLCRPYRTLLDPSDKTKSWSFKPISVFGWKFKIPFDWHIRRMVRFADKYGKRIFIYSADNDVTKEQALERLAIIKKYLS